MNEFHLWFSTGFSHILDWEGYDHILYVMVLCVMFTYIEWKKTLILITSFTIGHSITLALSVLNLISINKVLIEVLIPITIIITCLTVLSNRNKIEQVYKVNYGLALLFGFIHGMGLSAILKSMLGKSTNIILPLLSFNIGLEIGQLIIVCIMLSLSVFLIKFIKIKKVYWVIFISSIALITASKLLIDRIINFYIC